MFELFPDGPVYEYPQLVNITYSFVWAFLLSSIVAITHRLTFTGDYYPKNFFQSLIIGAIVTTMVMMAIGDSLARGLGVFGAMAIIRFRTRVDDPRDVLFLFAALSTGLAIGVYGFTISFVGTILFCATAFLLHASPFRSFVHHHQLTFTLDSSVQLESVLAILAPYSSSIRQLSIAITKEKTTRYTYGIAFMKNASHDKLIDELKDVAGLNQLRLTVTEMNTP